MKTEDQKEILGEWAKLCEVNHTRRPGEWDPAKIAASGIGIKVIHAEHHRDGSP